MKAFTAGLLMGLVGPFKPDSAIKGGPISPGSGRSSRCRKDTNKAVARRRRNRKIADRSKRLNWRLRK